MLGRLARYLRFVGCDTLYARGLTDDEIVRVAREEGRTILTRDRDLARRAPSALLLESPNLSDQWKAVRRFRPGLPESMTFERCSICNGPLRRADPSERVGTADGVPWDRIRDGLPLYLCPQCGHRYWEGTHTAEIRARLARWSAEESP